MRTRHPGPGELVAGAGGLLLLLAMFLPWFGLNGRARVPGSGEVITVGRGEVDAWEAFSGIDVLLLLVAALAIALLLLALVTTPPPELAVAVSGASALAALLIVYRLIDVPDLPIGDAGDTAYETGRRIGAFFGLICTAAIAWGAGRAGAAAAPAPAPATAAAASPAAAPAAPVRTPAAAAPEAPAPRPAAASAAPASPAPATPAAPAAAAPATPAPAPTRPTPAAPATPAPAPTRPTPAASPAPAPAASKSAAPPAPATSPGPTPAASPPPPSQPAAPSAPASPASSPAPTPAASPAPAPRPAPAPAAARPLAPASPLAAWPRGAIDAECQTAWRRYDRGLTTRYTRYFADHPELAGEQRTSARDLVSALPPGLQAPADAIPDRPWQRQHLSAKSSQLLAVGLLGVAASGDPSLTWLWDALAPLPPAAEDTPSLEFAHVVDPKLLGERPRQTGFDVLVDDPAVLIGIETKWREHGVEACRCRGDGVGPLESERCSRRVEQREPYWDAAADVLGLEARGPGAPCPISPAYEAVRHVAALRALAGADRPAVLVQLYDGNNPYFAGVGDWPGWPELLGQAVEGEGFRFAAISWQELVPLLPLDEPTRAWAAEKHGLA
jgi:Restriction Endonuclease associating with ARP